MRISDWSSDVCSSDLALRRNPVSLVDQVARRRRPQSREMLAAQRLFLGRKTHLRPAQPQARQYADIDRQYREHEQAINEVGFPKERQRQRDERCGGKADARIVDADDEARRQEEQQRSVKKPRGIEIRHSQSLASRPAPTGGSGHWWRSEKRRVGKKGVSTGGYRW